MPKVSEAHRQARRDEIADAALRVLRRNGVSNTSIAQIVEESGLSAGAIYANFENKAELARYIAGSLFDWRLTRVREPATEGLIRTPSDVLRVLLSTADADAPPADVLLQFWGEASRDEELLRTLTEKMDALRDAFAAAVLPWAEEQEPSDAAALAARTATTMVVLCQGMLANRALLGWVSTDEYLATAERLFTR